MRDSDADVIREEISELDIKGLKADDNESLIGITLEGNNWRKDDSLAGPEAARETVTDTEGIGGVVMNPEVLLTATEANS